jgi:hypothetical protein
MRPKDTSVGGLEHPYSPVLSYRDMCRGFSSFPGQRVLRGMLSARGECWFTCVTGLLALLVYRVEAE